MRNSPIGAGHKVGAFQIALLVFTMLVLCGLVADTLLILPQEVSNLLHLLDTFACAVFFVDFCFRLYRAESKLAFMKWGWIDLIACIPTLEILRYGRLVRVLRVIRLLRGVRSVQMIAAAIFQDRLRGSAVSVVFSAVLLVAFSSMSILICERQADGNIKTAEEALWWSITTITTVGYGDRYPTTTEGRAIGIVLMLAGVSMFGCISGLAASFFLGGQRANQSEISLVLARLDQLDAKLNTLNAKDSREMSQTTQSNA